MHTGHADIGPHEKFLLAVPREVMLENLRKFRFSETAMDIPSIVCAGSIVKVSPREAAGFQRYINPIDPPSSLEEMKSWFGVPNEAAKNLDKAVKIPANLKPERLNLEGLPQQAEFQFESLDQRQKLAVRRTASDLLNLFVSPEEEKLPQVQGVIRFMLNRATRTALFGFVCPDLVICAGQKFQFFGLAMALFNNILIYGDGQLSTIDEMKIHAQQIRHVDA